MNTLTEARHAGEFIISEGPGRISRDAVTIGSSQTIAPGALLAKLATAADVVATVAAAAGNTGNGVLTMANPAVSPKVKDGVYTVVCVTAVADGGAFRVEDPNGKAIGNAIVGSAFDREVKFTISDGAADFIVGDTFTITIAADAEDFTWVAHDPTAVNGSETPSAVAIDGAVTGPGQTARVAAITRSAEVNGKVISWAAGITDAQKADAVQALAGTGIIVR